MLIHNIPYLYIYIYECSYEKSAEYLLMLHRRISSGGAMACSHFGGFSPERAMPACAPAPICLSRMARLSTT